MEDLTGRKFGKWLVLSRNMNKEIEIKNEKGYKPILWHCKCECGTEQDIIQSNLIGHKTTQCRKHGKTPPNFQDLTGQVFGRLTVIERDVKLGKENKQVFWKCKCICGSETSVQAYKLKTGHTQSCGCLQKDKANEVHFQDLTGKKFGKLMVLSRDVQYELYKNDTQTYWYCLCDCGSKTYVAGGKLTSGWTQSCGCLNSHGELKIKQLLNANNVEYKYNYIFKDCVGIKNKPLKFDFAIFESGTLAYIVEFDGIQHFKSDNRGWNTLKSFQDTRVRDEIKNQYCWKHQIPLIRIPYYWLNNLTIKDLLLQTSDFVLTRQLSDKYYQQYS